MSRARSSSPPADTLVTGLAQTGLDLRLPTLRVTQGNNVDWRGPFLEVPVTYRRPAGGSSKVASSLKGARRVRRRKVVTSSRVAGTGAPHP